MVEAKKILLGDCGGGDQAGNLGENRGFGGRRERGEFLGVL